MMVTMIFFPARMAEHYPPQRLSHSRYFGRGNFLSYSITSLSYDPIYIFG